MARSPVGMAFHDHFIVHLVERDIIAHFHELGLALLNGFGFHGHGIG